MSLDSIPPGSALLAGLSEDSLRFLDSIAKELDLAAGTVVFDEDDPADSFYVVIEGRIGLEMRLQARPPILIETLGPGELLGVSWLFPPYRWNWRARALSDTRVMSFPAAEVRARIENDQGLAVSMFRTVAKEAVRRLHETRIRLLDLYPGLQK